MKPIAISLAGLFWLLCALPTAALETAGLYTGEAILAEEDGATPAARLRALDEVLVRLTGRVEVSPVAGLGLQAGDVPALVQSQQMVRVPRLDADGERFEQLRLRIEFDPTAINRLLARNGLPRWGRERPAILLWMAVEDDDGARLAEDPRLEQAVREAGRRYGLELIRPLGDALDLAEVQLADVRGGFLDAAEPGADRYWASMVAMLDLRAESDHWTGRWFWRLEGRDASRSLSADAPGLLIDRGVADMLAALVERYAMRPEVDSDGWQPVLVEGIVDPVQYAEVLRYLEDLSRVEGLRVSGAREREVAFELLVSGGNLRDALSLSRLLAVDRETPDGRLVLRLRQ